MHIMVSVGLYVHPLPNWSSNQLRMLISPWCVSQSNRCDYIAMSATCQRAAFIWKISERLLILGLCCARRTSCKGAFSFPLLLLRGENGHDAVGASCIVVLKHKEERGRRGGEGVGLGRPLRDVVPKHFRWRDPKGQIKWQAGLFSKWCNHWDLSFIYSWNYFIVERS